MVSYIIASIPLLVILSCWIFFSRRIAEYTGRPSLNRHSRLASMILMTSSILLFYWAIFGSRMGIPLPAFLSYPTKIGVLLAAGSGLVAFADIGKFRVLLLTISIFSCTLWIVGSHT